MKCPVCAGKLEVIMTRSDCERTFRRRRCISCRYAFFTVEEENKEAREGIKDLWKGNKD